MNSEARRAVCARLWNADRYKSADPGWPVPKAIRDADARLEGASNDGSGPPPLRMDALRTYTDPKRTRLLLPPGPGEPVGSPACSRKP